MTARVRRCIALLLALPLGLSACSHGAGGGDRVTTVTGAGGTTSLTLSRAGAQALATAGLRLSGSGAASRAAGAGTVISLPITSGYLVAHSQHRAGAAFLTGSLEHDTSGLNFTSSGRTLSFSNLVLDPAGGMAYANVVGVSGNGNGSAELPLLTLTAPVGTPTDAPTSASSPAVPAGLSSSARPRLDGLDVSATGTGLTLGPYHAAFTLTAATALGSFFHLGAASAVNPGLDLGTVTVAATGTVADASPRPAAAVLPLLTGVATAITLDAGTRAALRRRGVQFAPSGTASLSSSGALSFPVTGGALNLPGSGALASSGAPDSTTSASEGRAAGVVVCEAAGFLITAGSKSLALENPVVDTASGVISAYASGIGTTLPVFQFATDFAVTTSKGDPGSPPIQTLRGSSVSFTPTAVRTLGRYLLTGALNSSSPIGNLTVVAQGTSGAG